MDLNSPVKMILPQDVKTSLVPDSEMHTESSTNIGLSEESVSVKTEDGEILKPVFRTPPKDDEIVKLVYDTTAAGDFSGLENALARDHDHDSPEYAKRFERIKEIQLSFEGQAVRYGWGKYCGKLRMELLLDNRTGRVLLASFGVIG